MGWDGSQIGYWKNGKPDIVAEFLDRWHYTDSKFEVLKAIAKGSTIYSAIKNKDTEEVFGVVALTSRDGNYLMFKEMDETVHPYYYDCPKSVLDLLTPTENAEANAWRNKCVEYAEIKKTSPAFLKNGKVGDLVIWNDREILVHMPPYAQFRTDFWKILGENSYVGKTRVTPQNTVAFTRENLEQSFINAMETLGSKELYHGMPAFIKGFEHLDENSVELPYIYKYLFEPFEKDSPTSSSKQYVYLKYDENTPDKAKFIITDPINKYAYMTVDQLPENCQKAVREFIGKFENYKQSVNKDDVKGFENTLNQMATFGKSDVDIKKSQKSEVRE